MSTLKFASQRLHQLLNVRCDIVGTYGFLESGERGLQVLNRSALLEVDQYLLLHRIQSSFDLNDSLNKSFSLLAAIVEVVRSLEDVLFVGILHLLVTIAELVNETSQLLHIGLRRDLFWVGNLHVIEFGFEIVDQKRDGIYIRLCGFWVGFVVRLRCLHLIKSRLDVVSNDLYNSDVGLGCALLFELLGKSIKSLRGGSHNQLDILQVLLCDSSRRIRED